ncbi:MAG: glycosyltransferase family 2 protein [Planctomycetota bacterium]
MNLLSLSLLVFCIASVAVAVFVCLYHLGLMAVAFFCRGKSLSRNIAPTHTFAIVIPAHDEETTIQRTLDSCAALDYSQEKLAVYVIADNCTDRTADVARQFGAACLVRQDEHNLGKGFALEWALPQVLAAGHDAIVVLDADCTLDANSLQVLDAYLQKGLQALQMNNVVGNPDHNATSYLLAIANKLENDWFYSPKSTLGLAVNLRGTGMVLHRSILSRYPWKARSAVEDAEYSYRLFRGGVGVAFVSECSVLSDSPADRVQLAVQRTRWIGGGWHLACVQGVGLVLEGLSKRHGLLVDAGFTSFVLSRPLVLLQLLLTLIACCALLDTAYSHMAIPLLITTSMVATGYVFYGLTGAVLLGLTPHRIAMLFRLPPLVVRYVVMALVVLCSSKTVSWTRTPRS